MPMTVFRCTGDEVQILIFKVHGPTREKNEKRRKRSEAAACCPGYGRSETSY